MTLQLGLRTFFSCLVALLTLCLWMSANAEPSGTAENTNISDFTESCTAVGKEGERKARSLFQLSQEYKSVQAHEQRNATAGTSPKERLIGFSVYNGFKRKKSERGITFITVYDPAFEMNLGTSYLWTDRENHPHQWILIDNNHGFGISQMYAEVQPQAEHDLLVFLHPDITLPEEFYDRFMHKLWIIQEYDPNWGVLGVVGVPYGEFLSNSSITDFSQTYSTGSDFLPVQGVDEMLMVLKRGSPMFDAQLPGFDLYGLDIVLSARQRGQMSYLLNVPVFHKMKGVDGQDVSVESFNEKVDAPEYIDRVDKSAKYFQQKWCNSGFLPVRGPSFQVECGAWCKVITMLNRSHHNETCIDPTGEYDTWH